MEMPSMHVRDALHEGKTSCFTFATGIIFMLTACLFLSFVCL